MFSNDTDKRSVELIIGNSNSNFTGVTSTMLQVLEHQKALINLRVMGKHHLPDQNLAISFFEVAKLCRQPLKDGKYRIFHARRVDEMIQGVILKYIFGAKIRLVFSSAAQRYRSGLTLWLTRKMDAVIAMSQRSASYLADPPNLVNYHGINVDGYFPPEDKASAWEKLGYGGKRGIGILGRVRKQKGVDLFVKACIKSLPKHPDVTAVVVGAISGKNEKFVEELKEEIERAGLKDRIIFTGELPFDRISTIFSALSLVCALSNNEGFGLTVLEAMSSGAAVLATEAGAWPEIIREGEDGFIVPVSDQQAVNDKLNILLSDQEKTSLMGRMGRKRAEKCFRVENEAKNLIEYFRTLQ